MNKGFTFKVSVSERGRDLFFVVVDTSTQILPRISQPDLFRDSISDVERILKLREERRENLTHVMHDLGIQILQQLDKLDGWNNNEAMQTIYEIKVRGPQWSEMPTSFKIASEIDRLAKEKS